MSYEQVDRIFAAERRARPGGEPLQAARAAAAALERRASHSGALTLDPPEPEFAFDDTAHVEEVMRVQTESHRLIEHLMIAANEAVARLLSERGPHACTASTSAPSPSA